MRLESLESEELQSEEVELSCVEDWSVVAVEIRRLFIFMPMKKHFF